MDVTPARPRQRPAHGEVAYDKVFFDHLADSRRGDREPGAMLSLPGAPGAPQTAGTQAGGQACQIFLLPAPGGLESALRPGEFSRGWPSLAQGEQLRRNSLLDRCRVCARGCLKLDEELARAANAVL